jgi:SMODS-associated and fused to various effectors sensor domain
MRTSNSLRAAKTRRSVRASETKKPENGHHPASMHEITRHVPVVAQRGLWGKAAGRCEFAGCNQILWKSPVTQEPVNIAEKAHIYSFTGAGPRGNSGISIDILNSIENLMLVCHGCHRKIDQKRDGGRYSVRLLQQMKEEHERRIERVTGISPERTSHVLLYGANIGEHSSPLNYSETVPALFPDRYPASDRAIELSVHNSSLSDRDVGFWANEGADLYRKFDRHIRSRVAEGVIRHLSVFAIAPQPLLILFGTLLGDIVPSDVYQRHREPASWEWPLESRTPGFELRRPANLAGPPALVFELGATVAVERVHRVLGMEASIWSITVPSPHNDVTKSRRQVSEFRALVRIALEQIKAAHGQRTVLHVFPAMSVSLAVEFGRVRMPKADMPWQVYDQVNALGGFVPALSVPYGEERQ